MIAGKEPGIGREKRGTIRQRPGRTRATSGFTRKSPGGCLLFLTVAAHLSLAGCGTPAGEPGWTGTIEERDGVTRVSNPAEGLWAGEEDAGFSLELEQVFGVAAEPADAILAFITGLAVDGDGNVYVLDRSASALVAFAPDGEVLWRREGEGEGPELEEGAYGFGVGVRVFGESIWAGHRVEYLLREFDAEGTQLRAIAREFPDLIPPFVYRGTGWFLGEFQAPLRLDDGRLLVPVAWSTNVENAEDFRRKLDKARAGGSRFDVALDSALDLYDPEGRYLTSLAWEGMFPETGRPALVGRDGRLYTIVYEADFPQVRRYRVEILPPR